MKKYHKETKIIDTDVFDYIECDLCGHRSDKDGGYYNNWGESDYGIEGVMVSYNKSGESHPNDGFLGKTTSFDICPKCFMDVIVPFLSSLGAEPRIRKE